MDAILRKAIRDLIQRRLRSLLTVMGIIIGVAGIVGIVSTARNLVRAQAAAYVAASQADVTYSTWNAPTSLQRALEGVPNVAAAELRVTLYTRWRIGDTWSDVFLVGIVDFDNIAVNKITLKEGHFPGMDELLPEVSVRDLTGIRIGQEVAVRDRAGRVRYLKLSGFAQSPAYVSATLTHFPVVYASANRVRDLLGASGNNLALIRLEDYRQKDETLQELDRLFDKRGLPHSVPQVRDPRNFIGKRELDALVRVMLLFSILGLVLSGFLVANTLGAIAAEQVGEIGVLKAVGATRLQVLSVYLAAALLYGIVGTALGIALGASVGWQLLAHVARLTNIDVGFEVAPEGLVLGVIVGVGVTLAGGLIPTWSATAISVKAALETYGITSTYGQGRVDRVLQRLQRLPPVVAMSLRNLARRKTRNLITILVIAVATAALLAAQSTEASVAHAIDGIFRTYDADAWVSFNEAVGEDFKGMLRGLPNVQAVENWSLANVLVKRRLARVWGIPPDSTLYRPVMQAGRWLQPGEPETVVVSADLARDRDIHTGDRIELEIGQVTRTFQVVGVVVDNSIFLGATIAGKVFAPVESIDAMRQREGYADFFAIRLVDRRPAAVDATLAELERRFSLFRPVSESAHQDVAAARQPAQLLMLALYVMVLLVGGIGVIGVVNTLSLNVLERRREIGVLRAVGAADWKLLEAFLTEGLALGWLGWIAGLPAGYGLGWILVKMMEQVLFQLDYVVTPEMIALSFVLNVGVVALASVGPALGAARLRAGEALRYE